MNCHNVEKLLSAYIENELSKEVQCEISLHLGECAECSRLKDSLERLIAISPDLEEEVPFFLKNRLLNIAEMEDEESNNTNLLLKWIAAMIGTVILFLNLFYFTNIYPPANRALRMAVSRIERLAVETGAFFERIKESKENPLFSLFGEPSDEQQPVKKEKRKGGTNG